MASPVNRAASKYPIEREWSTMEPGRIKPFSEHLFSIMSFAFLSKMSSTEFVLISLNSCGVRLSFFSKNATDSILSTYYLIVFPISQFLCISFSSRTEQSFVSNIIGFNRTKEPFFLFYLLFVCKAKAQI